VVRGLAIGAGAVVLGSRVQETVGKGITVLCAIWAVFMEFVAAIIVHSASIMGIPFSLGKIVTAAIIGIGCANERLLAAKNVTVQRKITMWFVSPLVAGVITYAALLIIG
jgi:phosphate/sulfate permease